MFVVVLHVEVAFGCVDAGALFFVLMGYRWCVGVAGTIAYVTGLATVGEGCWGRWA